MAESYVDKVANELADLALADQKVSGDVGIVDHIGDVLGASSQTLQETYLTAVRVRRAEERARDILADRASKPPVPLAELIEDASAEDVQDDIEDAEIADVVATNLSEAPEEPKADPDEPEEEVKPASAMPRRVTR